MDPTDGRLLASLVDSSPDGLLGAAPSGAITFWGAGAERLFGHAPGDALGAPLDALLFAPSDQPAVRSALAAALADPAHADQRLQALARRKDGSQLTVAVLLRAGAGAGGTPFVAVTCRDVSERRTEFLNVLGHELRNPLASIVTSLALLDHQADPARSAHAAAVMRRQATHLTRLVDDLLDFSLVVHGQVQLVNDPLELATLVREVVDAQLPVAEAAKVALEVATGQRPIVLRGDRARLAQAMGNLVSNAIKFTPAAGRVRVSLEATATEALLRVEDTGVGVVPELLESMFEPFVRAERTLDRSRGGLGLGLSVVRGIVRLHGGAVRASSDGPDRGTTFTVTLPLGRVSPREARRVAPALEVATGPLRLLIVEDDVDGGDMLEAHLRDQGHDVKLARTGADGLASVDGWVPQVVLCDIGLPDMTGYTVARSLKSDPRLVGTKLVALTGYGHVQESARAVGFDLHLTKPVDPRHLEQILGRLVALKAPEGKPGLP